MFNGNKKRKMEYNNNGDVFYDVMLMKNNNTSKYEGFFNEDNIQFLTVKIKDIARKLYGIEWNFEKDYLLMMMNSVRNTSKQSVVELNEIVIMEFISSLKAYMTDTEKYYRFAENFTSAVDHFDDKGKKTIYDINFFSKGRSNPRIPYVQGPTNFYFTY